jgi:molecular chaperone DnaK
MAKPVFDVGLDFGTTNTVLCYHGPTLGANTGPQPYADPNGDQRGIHPTVLFRQGLKAVIGWAAIIWRGRVETKEHFKIALATCGGTREERQQNEAYKSTRDFLRGLLQGFTHHVDGSIGRLCICVPETWIGGAHQAGASALREICAELRLPEPILVSEPVAAASYFAHAFQLRHEAPYQGHLFVYDHGGGTLDLALVKVFGETITRISGDGLSVDLSDDGFGGVAFDRRVFRAIAQRHPQLTRLSQEAQSKWLAEFETQKRRASPFIQSELEGGAADREMFPVQDVNVRLGDLVGVFAEHFKNVIARRVESFLIHAKSIEPSLSFTDTNRFRVMTVGGFSEFALVQAVLREVMSRICQGQRVMSDALPPGERWLSVAKGGCLIAQRQTKVEEVCPYTFGLIFFDQGSAVPRYRPMIKQGDPAHLYAQPQMLQAGFSLQGANPASAQIKFYLEQAGRIMPLTYAKSLDGVLPDFNSAKSWQFGCSVALGIVQVEVLSDRGGRKMIPMGDFLALLDLAVGGRTKA